MATLTDNFAAPVTVAPVTAAPRPAEKLATVTFTDRYGATVTGDENTGWARGGMHLGPCAQADAETIFGGCTPDGWVPPVIPPQVPASCTNFQARAMLMQMPSATAGRTLFQDVDDALKAQSGTAWQAWEFANEFMRNGALVQSMGGLLGLSAAQLDAFFTQAARVSA